MTRLMVLGLLAHRPMHGYEIQQYLQVTQSQQWAGILPGSIYHALKKMEGEGLVQVQVTEMTGHRARAVYAITQKGREEFLNLLRGAWRTPSRVFPGVLYTAVSFIDDLPREEVLKALTEQISGLKDELAQWNEGEQAKRQAGDDLPEPLKAAVMDIQKTVFDNGRKHLEADLQLLEHIQETLPAIPVLLREVPQTKGE